MNWLEREPAELPDYLSTPPTERFAVTLTSDEIRLGLVEKYQWKNPGLQHSLTLAVFEERERDAPTGTYGQLTITDQQDRSICRIKLEHIGYTLLLLALKRGGLVFDTEIRDKTLFVHQIASRLNGEIARATGGEVSNVFSRIDTELNQNGALGSYLLNERIGFQEVFTEYLEDALAAYRQRQEKNGQYSRKTIGSIIISQFPGHTLVTYADSPTKEHDSNTRPVSSIACTDARLLETLVGVPRCWATVERVYKDKLNKHGSFLLPSESETLLAILDGTPVWQGKPGLKTKDLRIVIHRLKKKLAVDLTQTAKFHPNSNTYYTLSDLPIDIQRYFSDYALMLWKQREGEPEDSPKFSQVRYGDSTTGMIPADQTPDHTAYLIYDTQTNGEEPMVIPCYNGPTAKAIEAVIAGGGSALIDHVAQQAAVKITSIPPLLDRVNKLVKPTGNSFFRIGDDIVYFGDTARQSWMERQVREHPDRVGRVRNLPQGMTLFFPNREDIATLPDTQPFLYCVQGERQGIVRITPEEYCAVMDKPASPQSVDRTAGILYERADTESHLQTLRRKLQLVIPSVPEMEPAVFSFERDVSWQEIQVGKKGNAYLRIPSIPWDDLPHTSGGVTVEFCTQESRHELTLSKDQYTLLRLTHEAGGSRTTEDIRRQMSLPDDMVVPAIIGVNQAVSPFLAGESIIHKRNRHVSMIRSEDQPQSWVDEHHEYTRFPLINNGKQVRFIVTAPLPNHGEIGEKPTLSVEECSPGNGTPNSSANLRHIEKRFLMELVAKGYVDGKSARRIQQGDLSGMEAVRSLFPVIKSINEKIHILTHGSISNAIVFSKTINGKHSSRFIVATDYLEDGNGSS